MLWIALHLPGLPLQAFARGLPEPGLMAVVEYRPRQRLIAVSAQALACGVEAGGNVAGALAVAPTLELLDRNRTLEHDTLKAVANWAGRFTPDVSIAAPDAVLLEVSRSLRLFGGLGILASSLEQAVPELGLQIRFAAAPTPLAARWLAECRPGLLIKPEQVWKSVLDPLPVAMLATGGDVTPATLELLEGIGIHRIADIARLPRDGLARRHASAVMHTLALARGEIPDPRPWHVPPARFESRLVLPCPVLDSEPLLFASGRLIADLVAWLDRLHAAVDRCRLVLEHDEHEDTVLDIVTARPDRDAGRLQLILREQLAALELAGPVEALRLSADDPVMRSSATPDLFGDPARDADAASLLLERLRARLGTQAVTGLTAWPDHRPERALRVAEPGRDDAARPAMSAAARPLWLLPQPRPLASIRMLTLESGPERIESGWWDDEDVRRDYFVARSADAARWWIFRRLDPPEGWYVHGYFG